MNSITDIVRKFAHRLCSGDPNDKFLTPQMSGPLESSDAKAFRRMVQKGRLAPFYPGYEDSDAAPGLEMCPICCMHYTLMNKLKCCRQRICSECVFKIHATNDMSLSQCPCPFCKKTGIQLEVQNSLHLTLNESFDELDQQRFVESKFRERIESARGEVENDSETTAADESRTHSNMEEADLQSPLATLTAEFADSTRGESSFEPIPVESVEAYDIPRDIQEEYHQEYNVMSQRGLQDSLSNMERNRCSEYLGICPSDLGLGVDEFNDLLLEQTLISSMSEQRQTGDRAESPLTHSHSHEGTVTVASEASMIQEENESQSPMLCVHSVPDGDYREGVEKEEEEEEDKEGSSSLAPILQELSNLFATDDSIGQDPGPSTSEGNRSLFHFPELLQNQAKEQEETRNLTHPSSIELSMETNQAREVADEESYEYDDPNLNQTSNNSNSSDSRPNNLEGLSTGQTSTYDNNTEHNEFEITEAFHAETKPPGKTVAVQNPDGSLVLISAPQELQDTVHLESEDTTLSRSNLDHNALSYTAPSNSIDTAVILATREADAQQRHAITDSDERLKKLFSSN